MASSARQDKKAHSPSQSHREEEGHISDAESVEGASTRLLMTVSEKEKSEASSEWEPPEQKRQFDPEEEKSQSQSKSHRHVHFEKTAAVPKYDDEYGPGEFPTTLHHLATAETVAGILEKEKSDAAMLLLESPNRGYENAHTLQECSTEVDQVHGRAPARVGHPGLARSG